MCPFLSKHLDDESLRDLVVGNFRQFFRYNVSRYHRTDLTVGAIGSVAFYFRKQLEEAALAEGFTMGEIVRSPMDGLVAFHEKIRR